MCRQCPTLPERGRSVPGSLSVRTLDNSLILSLRRRAAGHGHSAEAEVRDILRQVLAQASEVGFDDLAAEMRALTAGRNHTPAETLLRDSRDER